MSGWRVAVAILLVVGGVALVAYFATRPRHPVVAPVAKVDPGEMVRTVAARFGCGPDRVTVEPGDELAGKPWVVTIHAPRGLRADRLVLDLEAAAHNQGGRLEPRPLTEAGGYGLARVDGEVTGRRLRVIVLGEPPAREARRPAATPSGGPELAIVLDDAGYSLAPLADIARLPKAVAVAVLPNAPFARETARELGHQGREVLLHMPMEPIASHGPDPGPGAVDVGLPDGEVERRVAAALDTVAVARGVNNHMGSRATADVPLMQAVMRVIKERGLYFLDSRTTPDTVAEKVARETGVPATHRDVFLDVVDEPDAVRAALAQAVARARAQGGAVAIGHVHPVTIAVLEAELPQVLEGVKLVPPSRLATR